MPCGWLYVFVFAAAGTGSPFWGAMVLMTFWLGSLPALGGLMLGALSFVPRFSARMSTVMAAVMILLGIYTMLWRGTIELRADMLRADAKETLQHVDDVDPHSLPCCCHSSR